MITILGDFGPFSAKKRRFLLIPSFSPIFSAKIFFQITTSTPGICSFATVPSGTRDLSVCRLFVVIVTTLCRRAPIFLF
jgi:hypothetical protein